MSQGPSATPLPSTLLQVMQQAGAAYSRGDWVRAEQLAQTVLQARATHFDALNLVGVIAAQTQRTDEAAILFARAVSANPGNAAAHNNYGNALRSLKRLDAALASYDRALQLQPDSAVVHCNRGDTLQEVRRFDEALASYDRALQLKPDYADAHNNRGNALQELRRFEEALASYDRALHFRPDDAPMHNNRGCTLRQLRRFEEALASFDRALQIAPEYAEAHCNRGNTLRDVRRFADARDSYQHALQLRPELDWLYGMWLHARMQVCDWNHQAEQSTWLAAGVAEGRRLVTPFIALSIADSLALQRQAAQIWLQGEILPTVAPAFSVPKHAERIRLGYFSADYHDHATARLTAELFELHDRKRFEIVAFSFGPDKRDAMRARLEAAFDSFVDVRSQSDSAIARASRERNIDIAVDLKGFSLDARPGIFACRAAPIQVNYLGYPGTLSAPHIDYLIADRTVIPPEARSGYTERIVYLPDSYQVNDRQRRIAARTFTRAELGLPPTGFVYCCFNNNYKISPETFDGWMRILRQVPGSVLWLLADNETAADNLRAAARAREVDPGRLIFAARMPLPEHLARHRAANLFLDTLPYNAHTTASDALWAGLPVLTLAGRSFAARVAASLSQAAGLPELITTTQQQYESLAIELACNPGRLAQIAAALGRDRLSLPLFNTPQFTCHLEGAYLQMYERYLAGSSPEDIFMGLER